MEKLILGFRIPDTENMSLKNPKCLFKYLSFGERLLEQLCFSQVYYADPASFNDPLDCQPVVKAEVDISEDALEQLLIRMVMRRFDKEIDVAMKTIRLRGEKATARRTFLAERAARNLIEDIKHNAKNPEIDDKPAYYRWQLTQKIEREMRKGYDTGVLCLSNRFDSPLMWSHYADQHRGVCIEYDVSMLKPHELHKVSYGDSREVLASQLMDFILEDNKSARSAIDKICLLTKAREWKYEQEWRILGPLGIQESPVKLKSIIFGMNCPHTLQYTVVKSLEGHDEKVKFWLIKKPSNLFQLKRERIDTNELTRCLPRMFQMGVHKDFEDLTDSDKHNGDTPEN